MIRQCEIHESLYKIHDEIHLFEKAMQNCAAKVENGVVVEQRELGCLMEKILSAVVPLMHGVPKYRVGLCYYSIMLAFCDLTMEDRDELDKANAKAKKDGAC